MKFTIRTKMLLAFSLVILICVGAIFYNFSVLSSLIQKTDHILKVAGPVEEAAHDLRQSLNVDIREIKEYGNGYITDADEVESIIGPMEEKIKKDIEKIEASKLVSSKETSLLKDLLEKDEAADEKIFKLKKDTRENIKQHIISNEVFEAVEAFDDINKEVNQVVEKIISIIGQDKEKDIQDFIDKIERNKADLVIAFSAAITLSLIIAYIFSLMLSASVRKVRDAALKMGTGDLSQRAQVKSKDEVGELANAFNQMAENIENSQKQIKENRDHIQAIISSIGEGVFVVDGNYNVVLMNPVAEKLLGKTFNEARSKSILNLFSLYKGNKRIEDASRPVVKAMKGGKAFIVGLEEDFYFVTKNKRFPVAIAETPLKGNGVTGVVVAFRDITAEKNVKDSIEKQVVERTQQLAQEQARLRASISSLPVGFVMTDTKGKIITMNGIAKSLLCLKSKNNSTGVVTKENLKHLDCDLDEIGERLKGNLDIKSAIGKVIKNRQPFEIKDLTLDDLFLHIFIVPVINVEKEKFLVIGSVILVENITEQKILDRSRDEFFSIASHELRTPLTAIKGNTSMMLDYYGEQLKDPQLKEMVDDVHESSVRLIEIVNDFLDTSRLELNKMEFKKDVFDLSVLIPNVIKQYQVTSSRKKLDINFESKEKMPNVVGDQDRFRQVLINLLGNALKFTEKGGITVSLKKDGNFVKILVADTGMGISEENQKLLFRKFQQAESNILTRDVIKGTGLGLYISKMLVGGMGGKISLESSMVGKGSTFSFTLPVATKADEIAAKAAAAKLQADFHVGPAMNTDKSNVDKSKPKE